MIVSQGVVVSILPVNSGSLDGLCVCVWSFHSTVVAEGRGKLSSVSQADSSQSAEAVVIEGLVLVTFRSFSGNEGDRRT